MLFSHTTFIGIDPTAGRKPFTFAALDMDGKLLALTTCELDEVLAFVGGQQAATVAVNAPPRPNIGLVRKKLEKQSLTPSHVRGADMRLAEHLLRERGINVSATPSQTGFCSEWTQMGFDLYRRLEKMGFKPYPAAKASHQVLETHPHAAFCALLGQPPLPKPTLEGRLQRQVILHKQGLGIKDPMGFFEEITRHRLMHGVLPVELIYATGELDALVAAFTAFIAAQRPDELCFVGAKEEGRIALPVEELKERY
jgi:predicted nuclease with RNAse H fold